MRLDVVVTRCAAEHLTRSLHAATSSQKMAIDSIGKTFALGRLLQSRKPSDAMPLSSSIYRYIAEVYMQPMLSY